MTNLFGVPARHAIKAGEIDCSESIPVLHKRLQIRARYIGFMANFSAKPLKKSYWKTLHQF